MTEIIKPRPQKKTGADFAEQTWKVLEQANDEIF